MTIDYLPFTLITSEILPWLPSKSIGRCRCVCKQWRSFLSTHMFNRMHLHHHVTIDDHKLLLCDDRPPLPFLIISLNDGSITIPYNPPNPAVIATLDRSVCLAPNRNPKHVVSVIATLDGLVLVCLASIGIHSRLVFWNPLTGAYKQLSSIPRYCPRDPGALNSIFRGPTGFYIDSSNDYRLVCITWVSGGKLSGAYVYSHRLDYWREIDSSVVTFNNFCIWSRAILCDQCVYFTITSSIESRNWAIDERSRCDWVICFDVKTETFRKIRVPSLPEGATFDYGISLVVLNGCIHMSLTYKIYYDRMDYVMHGDLWRMVGDELVKVAIYSDPEGRQEQCICTASAGDWLAVFDPDENAFKKMNTEDFITHYQYFSSLKGKYISNRIIYVESLVSPIL